MHSFPDKNRRLDSRSIPGFDTVTVCDDELVLIAKAFDTWLTFSNS